MKYKDHAVVVSFICEDAQDEKAALKRFREWIEVISETAAAHGFEVRTVEDFNP